jgi:hypothetical protein
VPTVDLRTLEGDQIVIHFGGALTSVDAYTFANSLVSFADTARAVNAVINPGQSIEIRLEAVGPGSFRAVIKRIQKGLGGFFSTGAQTVFWGIIVALIYDKLIKADPESIIRVGPNEVVIERGSDKIIISKEIYDQAKNAGASPEVQTNLSRTFEVIEGDDAIESFGLTHRMDDREPAVEIPRREFPRLAERPVLLESDHRRSKKEKARLVILKAWLKPGARKWSFEWNGVPITAPIKDPEFWKQIEGRKYLIGSGDALDVEIAFEQIFEDAIGTYVNDPNSYVVEKVIRPIPKAPQPPLLPD